MAYSRYGHLGKGLTDRGSRAYASGLSGTAHRDYTTYVTRHGIRKARGSWQAVGHTAASLGWGAKSFSQLYGHLPSGAQASLKRTFDAGGYDPTTGYGAKKAFAPYGGIPEGRKIPDTLLIGSSGGITSKGQGIVAPSSFDFSNLFKGVKGGVSDPSGNRGSGGWLAMLRGGGRGLGIPPAEDTKGGIGGLSLGIGLILLKVLS